MLTYLHELYSHQEWADAEHWRAFESHPAALADKAIRDRLHHIHLVQSAFLWIAGPRTTPFVITKPEDFSNPADLKTFAQKGHQDFAALLAGLDDDSANQTLEIPWIQPPLKISRRHALMQAAMHSHYHRGQNATRLRELGGVPPITDFIMWLCDGQPKARWE
jgi:uncharacterized damage-inducible protein DinB